MRRERRQLRQHFRRGIVSRAYRLADVDSLIRFDKNHAHALEPAVSKHERRANVALDAEEKHRRASLHCGFVKTGDTAGLKKGESIPELMRHIFFSFISRCGCDRGARAAKNHLSVCTVLLCASKDRKVEPDIHTAAPSDRIFRALCKAASQGFLSPLSRQLTAVPTASPRQEHAAAPRPSGVSTDRVQGR